MLASFLITFFMLVLILVCAFVVLVVLMQKTSNSGGMGSALGGGATEQVLGADTTSVLTKATIYGIVAFFVVALGLHVGYLGAASDRGGDPGLRGIVGEEVETPAFAPATAENDASTSADLIENADGTSAE